MAEFGIYSNNQWHMHFSRVWDIPMYLRYKQNKKIMSFETPGCCVRLAILCSDGSKVDKNEPRDQLTVSYSKEKDAANILQGGGKSASPSEEVTSDFLTTSLPEFIQGG